jgi:DUF4097 and DUF4098 domain-containing protein YvlB
VNGTTRRGRSIFAGVLLVLLGVLFLIDIYYPSVRLGHLIAVYWPVLLIVWGAAKIFDYVFAQRRGEPRPAALTGGEAALIIVLILVLGGFVIRDWVRQRVPRVNFDMPEFGPSYSQSESLPPQSIPAGAHVAIYIPRGDISVQGNSGNQLLVKAKETAWGMSQNSAARTMKDANVRIDESGGVYRIGPQFTFGGQGRTDFDLNVQGPASANVAATTMRGDIHIQDLSGKADVHTNSGDIDVRSAGADVALNLLHGDARVTGAAGKVTVTGRGGDVSIADVKGEVSVNGGFDGTIRASNVSQTIHCGLPWSQINVAQLNGTLEADLGDVKISGANGPVKVATHNSDVSVNNVTGRVEITDAHADVKVTLSSPPTQDINITDDAGDVDVALPARSSFEVDAISRGGDVDSDFSGAQLNVSNTDASGQVAGRVGSGGPKITIATTYGTIHLRKSFSK